MSVWQIKQLTTDHEAVMSYAKQTLRISSLGVFELKAYLDMHS
jgi:hypothetical protein